MRSEEWFEQYLRDTGHDGADEPEPDLGGTKRPDYLVQKNGARAIVEVKEFEVSDHERRKRAALERGQSFEAHAKKALQQVRGRVHDAARQLKPFRDLGLPLVVVLANPRGVLVRLDSDEVGWALYGDPTVSGWVDARTGERVHMTPVRGHNGRLTNSHPYLSAIAVLSIRPHAADFYDEWYAEHGEPYPTRSAAVQAFADATRKARPPDGSYPVLNVFHTLASERGDAVPLAPELFDGARDQHWCADESGIFRRVS
jgi:hypothetical protein